MYAVNFEYDGLRLSDYGFIICDFDNASGLNIYSTGSVITFNKISRNKGKKYSLIGTQYDECVSATFDICKNPDKYEREDMGISSAELRFLMKWLNRRDFLKFQLIDENNSWPYYYEASFNIEKIIIGGIVYGLRLTMQTDSPFAYEKEKTIVCDFNEVDSSNIVNYVSDEIGSICPHITVYCNADGNLQIYNKFEGCTTLIRNCKTGEIITMDGETQIISTSHNGHDICNDFNYEFMRIGTTMDTNENTLIASIPCRIEIRYSPIVKDVL